MSYFVWLMAARNFDHWVPTATMVVFGKIGSKTPKDINFAKILHLLVPMALKWIKEYIKIKKG